MSESKRSMQPDDLFALQFIQSAELSPDGKRVAYALSTYDKESDTDRIALWLVDAATGDTRQMTAEIVTAGIRK